MKDKIILYLSGGAMMGVFGAGIVTGLQNMNFYEKIEAIYANSAGAFNGAYFLTKQSMLGSFIYWEDLTENFIFSENIPYGAMQRLWNGYVHKIDFDKITNAMNLDHLIDVVKKSKVLDIKKLKSQKIPLYVKYFDVIEKRMKYIDIRKENCHEALKASAAMIPYYFPKLWKGRYVDDAIRDPLGIKYIREKYPDKKIVAGFNLSTERKSSHYIKNFIEGIVSNAMFRGTFSKCFMKRERNIRENLQLIEKDDKILLLNPAKEFIVESWTTDREKLKKCHKAGMETAKKIKEFVENDRNRPS